MNIGGGRSYRARNSTYGLCGDRAATERSDAGIVVAWKAGAYISILRIDLAG
jgi:hypothetical protein